MSIFENSHHFEVIGGKFYAVTGDVNIEKASSSRLSNVQASGVQRGDRRGARYTPYSISALPPERLTLSLNDLRRHINGYGPRRRTITPRFTAIPALWYYGFATSKLKTISLLASSP
ncbi:hypothetical protein BDP27DRAFT_1361964 [Rhodocollybia butyracea]|uniref:Uncharacterized protein n=1 Tax=Rhodocollybia butyracea TaxID=206335 RepID=A0A9P5Q023_9AGAR|nr:hypothetical protein BDP27DRAFT_1361964 [Rhodocollybia butyracea]